MGHIQRVLSQNLKKFKKNGRQKNMSPNMLLDKYGSWLSYRINDLVLLWYGIARNILCRSVKFYDEPSQTKKNIRCQNLKKFK